MARGDSPGRLGHRSAPRREQDDGWRADQRADALPALSMLTSICVEAVTRPPTMNGALDQNSRGPRHRDLDGGLSAWFYNARSVKSMKSSRADNLQFWSSYVYLHTRAFQSRSAWSCKSRQCPGRGYGIAVARSAQASPHRGDLTPNLAPPQPRLEAHRNSARVRGGRSRRSPACPLPRKEIRPQ